MLSKHKNMLSHLEFLKNDMQKKNWAICGFLFSYKGQGYIVLVKRFVRGEKRENKYALVKLHFMKNNDLNDDLQVEANRSRLIIGAKALRQYFGIAYSDNIGDILRQFTERLGRIIPKTVPTNLSDLEKKAIVNSLKGKNNAEDINKIYCYAIKRNPGKSRRSAFNTNKTRLLRPSLFQYFCNDPSISFCYSCQPLMENDDATILRNFSKRAGQ